MLKLYYAPGACSLASHIALEETGGGYESERVTGRPVVQSVQAA